MLLELELELGRRPKSKRITSITYGPWNGPTEKPMIRRTDVRTDGPTYGHVLV